MSGEGKIISYVNRRHTFQVGLVRAGDDDLDIVCIVGQGDKVPAVAWGIGQGVVVFDRLLIDKPAADINLDILVNRIEGDHIADRIIHRDRT